jgi:hypothetical protein
MSELTFRRLNGVDVLVSSGADDFDPSSLLDEEQVTTESKNHPYIILAINSNTKLDLHVVGLFERLTVEKNSISLEMLALADVLLGLTQLVLDEHPAKLISLDVHLLGSQTLKLTPKGFELHSVDIATPLSNRVKVKIIFRLHE